MTEPVPELTLPMGTVPYPLSIYWRQPEQKFLLVARAANWPLAWFIGQAVKRAHPDMEVVVTTDAGRLREVHGTIIAPGDNHPGGPAREPGPSVPALPENQIRLPL